MFFCGTINKNILLIVPQKMPSNFIDLFQIASSQQGCFTASQAKRCGYSQPDQAYHVKAKNWYKLNRGIFGLTYYPFPKNPDLITTYLWSLDIQDKPVGVFSYATALNIYKLSDWFDNNLHMTVPLNFRRRSMPPSPLILHKANITESDVQKHDCYLVTTALRTIIDLLNDDTIEQRFLIQALIQALNKGLILKSHLKERVFSATETTKLNNLLDKVGINV